MSLTRPVIVSPIIPFDKSIAYNVDFTVVGGNQVFANELEIQILSDNTQVYLQKIDSFQFRHLIPANTLTNGTEYRMRIRTYDINNNTSAWSDWVVFLCLNTPVVAITNITDGKVNNHTYDFVGSYSQSDGELIQSYRFLLYDEFENLIGASPEKFDGLLLHQFTGLQNGKQYKIELKIITVNQMQASSGLVSFVADYIQPNLFSVLTLENISNQASILVSANIIRIIGELGSGEMSYIDDELIDLTNGMVFFQDGFNVNSNFTLKLWAKNIPTDQVFVRIMGEQGYIDIVYYDNRVHAFKRLYSGGILPHYASNELIGELNSNDMLFIGVRNINDMIDLYIEKVVI